MASRDPLFRNLYQHLVLKVLSMALGESVKRRARGGIAGKRPEDVELNTSVGSLYHVISTYSIVQENMNHTL
jgi:hypothetical protein